MVTLLLLSACTPVCARTLQLHADRVVSPVARMTDVHVRLDWPDDTAKGALTITAGRVDADDLGYHFRDLSLQCELARPAAGRWYCDGPIRSGRGRPAMLTLDLGPSTTHAALAQGRAQLAIARHSQTPNDTEVDLTRVPVHWAQALLAQAWQAGQLKTGTLDARLRVRAPSKQPLDVAGSLMLTNVGLDTPDATIAAERLGGRFAIDYRKTPMLTTVDLSGPLRGGAFLIGNAYVDLPQTPVSLRIAASQSKGAGWQLPLIDWQDGSVMSASGSASFDTQTNMQNLDLQVHSTDIAPLGKRYLSGWLGVAGLGDLQLSGAADGAAHLRNANLQSAELTLHHVRMVDAEGRFRFDGLDGTTRFSATSPVAGMLQWQRGQLYGIDFAGASLPIDSSGGEMRLRHDVSVPLLGGTIGFEHMMLRPPGGQSGAQIGFGLRLDRLDIGQLSKAMGWPAFAGQLSGHIPNARYASERLLFDGGLTMQLFGGTVQATSLSMERPFGTAPSLNADLAIDNVDLLSLTHVFDFGSITGRLGGRIDGLHMVDWTATAFDADLHTQSVRGVRRRISQRAVQNISSVGDASFASTLQSRLIGLFKDFGYSRIGITCRLVNDVCTMGGLHDDALQALGQRAFGRAGHTSGSEGAGFTIVEGAGIPHLTVVGYKRQVDWPTLVERLSAVSKGDVKPVVQ